MMRTWADLEAERVSRERLADAIDAYSGMINTYRRRARTWSEMALGPLGMLDELIPEFREACPTARPMRQGAEVAEWQTQRIQNPPR